MPKDAIELHQGVEETEVSGMLEELLDMGVEDQAFDAKFLKFKDVVLEHAVEVEEARLFPIVRRGMSRQDLEDLGHRMEHRRVELTRELEAQAR